MSLRSCSFLQWFELFEPARQGRMVSLGRVMMQSLTTTNPRQIPAKATIHDRPII
jgi:hypothetical protein